MKSDTDRKNEEPPDGAGAATWRGAVVGSGGIEGMPVCPSEPGAMAINGSREEPRRSSRRSVGTPEGTSRGRRQEGVLHHRLSPRRPKGLVKDQTRRRPRRRQPTLGGRSGGPETAGIKSGSSRASQAPAVEASTGARLERTAARSRSGGLVASLGASGATGARPQEGPLQGRRRRGRASLAVAASSASPLVTSGEGAGMSWPTSQSPQLAWADWREPSAINASTTTIPQQRRNRV